MTDALQSCSRREVRRSHHDSARSRRAWRRAGFPITKEYEDLASEGVAMVLAQEFCFFKLENGSPSASKQETMDMLLTTNMGPLRWTLRHWREHRSRAGGPCGLQHEKRRKSECVLRRAHVSSDRCNIVCSHRPFLSCDGRGPSNVSVFESRQDKITVTSSRLDSDTLCARCRIQASQPRHRATSSHP